jgi:hypothetical protein
MTRQPAEANRFTVAWPMPRLAPVRTKVRRLLAVRSFMIAPTYHLS